MLQSYEGSCHCGRVKFRVRADLADLLECNCSVCTKKGILHLIVPPEDFELVAGGDELATYQFNTNTARHTFCRHCGTRQRRRGMLQGEIAASLEGGFGPY